MKKVFTFFAAALFSAGMMADVVYSFTLDANTHTAKNTEYAVDGGSVLFGAEKFETQSGVYVYKLDGSPSDGNSKYALLKLDNAVAEGDVITIDGLITSNPTNGRAYLLSDSRAATTQYVSLQPTGAKNAPQQVTWTVPAGNAIIGATEIYISRESESLFLSGVTIENAAAPSTDPVLHVSLDTIDMHLSAALRSESHTVTFTGKNLTPGNYAINVPNLAGLSADPTSVTVGADGKLNAAVVLTYTSAVDVAAGVTSVNLSIDNLTAAVAIRYSADMTVNYATSVNIEQWVLDNGTDTEAFKAVLNAAHIDFENVNALDSLNDAKDHINYPYLGLKLKTQGANMGCWLQQGSTIKVRFGNVGGNILVAVNGETTEMTAADLQNNTPEDDKVLIFPTSEMQVTGDSYVQIITKSEKTVVIKQIMINEEIAAVILPTQTAIDNTLATPKATKRIVNGQVIIEKNGKFYDLLGAEVK